MPGLTTPYGVTTSKSEGWRQERGQIVHQMRSLLDASSDPTKLGGEDETRYQALVTRDDELAKAIERDERQAKRDAEMAAPIAPASTPTRDTPGADATTRTDKPVNPRSTPEYQAAFARYLQTGQARGLQSVESRATANGLQADADTAGGFTYPDEQFVANLIKFVDDAVYIRGRANVQRVVNADSLGAPSLDADPEDGDWTQELTTVDFDSQMEFGKRELRPHELTKGIKVSRKLINRSRLGIVQLVQQRLAYKMAVTEERAFLSGNGVNKPLGLFTASSDGISTGRDVTAAATTSWTGDNLIDMLYSLKAQYQRTAVWIMHRDGAKLTRKLKDGNGQYLWAPGLTAAEPDTILNRPLVLSEFAPNTYTTGLYTVLLGDLSFYWIADAEDVAIQRLDELYAATNQVGFIVRAATDGMPVLEEAFARLKLA